MAETQILRDTAANSARVIGASREVNWLSKLGSLLYTILTMAFIMEHWQKIYIYNSCRVSYKLSAVLPALLSDISVMWRQWFKGCQPCRHECGFLVVFTSFLLILVITVNTWHNCYWETLYVLIVWMVHTWFVVQLTATTWCTSTTAH